jgi:hypothetical protein
MRAAALATVMIATMTCSGCLLAEMLGLPTGDRVPYNPMIEQAGADVIQRNVQFNDIPVPVSLKLQRREMFSYKCPSFRVGVFPYIGTWPYRKTRAFYHEQMELHGWSKLSEEEGDVTAVQHWAKGSQRARVFIDTSGARIFVLINVYPVGSEPEPVSVV